MTWDDISAIVFINSTTDVLSACVSVVRFFSATVWSCCILVNNATLACVYCTFDAYPSLFEILNDIRVSLNALAR